MQCKRGVGMDYRGTEAKTRRGIPCQKWAEKTPHKPKYVPIFIPLHCSEPLPSFLIFIYIHRFMVQVMKSCQLLKTALSSSVLLLLTLLAENCNDLDEERMHCQLEKLCLNVRCLEQVKCSFSQHNEDFCYW